MRFGVAVAWCIVMVPATGWSQYDAPGRHATVRALQADPVQYSWQLFRRLNSPVDQPQGKSWERSFRQTSDIFLPDGTQPAPWGTATPLPPEVVQELRQLPDWAASPMPHNLDTAIQADGLVLRDKWNNEVRYQLLMNRLGFEYILDRSFYNINGQENAARRNQPADFPWATSELKTSWIWVEADDQAKFDELKQFYYMARAYYQMVDRDGRPTGWNVGFAALTGMHVSSKIQPDWFWTTFENVKNGEFTQIKLELPIAPHVAKANQRNQQQLAAMGSVFANYQLNGTQLTFTVGNPPRPTLLANSQIESAFQTQSSCITCHAAASINKHGAFFKMASSSGGNVSYYIGNPPDVNAAGYTALDFAWSLKRAKRFRPPTE